MTLTQLQGLLDQQKDIVVEKLRGRSGYYNKESTEGTQKTLSIDGDKFREVGGESGYPDDYNVLTRYLIKD